MDICIEDPYVESKQMIPCEYNDSDSDEYSDSNSDDSSDDERPPRKEAMVMEAKNSLWRNGEKISVRFLAGGTRELHEMVIYYAKEWEKHANIKFDFVRSRESDVRISFQRGSGSWSMVGTAARRVPEPKATMNLDISVQDEQMLKRRVLHEFGHVLGCKHEHSSPDSNIPWNKQAIYKHYENQYPRLNRGMAREKADHNVLEKFRKNTVSQYSRFDRHSIMIYPIPKKWLKEGSNYKPITLNTELSATDKAFIGRTYPKRPQVQQVPSIPRQSMNTQPRSNPTTHQSSGTRRIQPQTNRSQYGNGNGNTSRRDPGQSSNQQVQRYSAPARRPNTYPSPGSYMCNNPQCGCHGGAFICQQVQMQTVPMMGPYAGNFPYSAPAGAFVQQEVYVAMPYAGPVSFITDGMFNFQF